MDEASTEDDLIVEEAAAPVVSPPPPWADWASIAIDGLDDPRALALAAGSAAGPSDMIIDAGRFYVRNVTQAALDAAAAAYDPTARAKDELLAYAASTRWQKEVGGVVVAGVPVATDDRSKLMITGARIAAMLDPEWSTIWHGSDQNTYPIDATAMIAISDDVQAHVNATFATFAAVKAAIDAGTITTTAEVDAAFE
ncbi:protein of unknown function [Bosea lupini]|uniref:DUF4376 domain-containing protein n=1 Tax=Bosea lupini TaxID=1036779 RepID=A0A1H7PV97_9HYPH|nr:DUF4376 domain-containing protein [Bosea lupini]SEL39324.1 protein of unknown function [Bosea lupini]